MKREREQETSSGALIGYAIIALAVVFIIAFIIFAIFKSANKEDNSQPDSTATAYVIDIDQLNLRG